MLTYIDFAGEYGERYKVYSAEQDKNNLVLTGLISPSSAEGDFPHPKQVQYFDATTSHVLFGGARGGGKTEAIVFDHLFKAYLVPGSVTIIFRRTIGELLSTIIDRYRSLPPELVGQYIAQQSNRHMLLPNGSKIRFASAKDEKDVRKYLSGEYLMASFDEWSEWPYTMWKFIEGSVRWKVNRDVYNRPIRAQIKGATNPGGEGGDSLNHLFGCDIPKSPCLDMDKETYDPKNYLFIFSKVEDNPAYSLNTEQGQAYVENLLSQPPSRRAAWLEGKWTGFEGQYFDCFNKDMTGIDHDEVVIGMEEQKHQPIWLSIDYGKVHYAYCAWHTFLEAQLDDGTVIKVPVTYREYLTHDLGEAAFAEEVARLTPQPERKRIDKIYLSPELGSGTTTLSRAHVMSDVWIAKGMPRSSIAFNKREDGWSIMYNLNRRRYTLLMKSHESPRTICGWVIDKNCRHALEALPWAMSDPSKDGDIKSKGDNPMLDILDGLRYGIASHIKPEAQKPFADRISDALGKLPMTGTSRYIKWLKMKAEERKSSQPYYTGPKTGLTRRIQYPRVR